MVRLYQIGYICNFGFLVGISLYYADQANNCLLHLRQRIAAKGEKKRMRGTDFQLGLPRIKCIMKKMDSVWQTRNFELRYLKSVLYISLCRSKTHYLVLKVK